MVETKNNFNARGASGEKGKSQLMPGRWEALSKEILGYVAPFTEINEEYVVTRKLEQWQKQGFSTRDISLMWNQGHTGECSSGFNKKYSVYYDSCAHALAVVSNYQN